MSDNQLDQISILKKTPPHLPRLTILAEISLIILAVIAILGAAMFARPILFPMTLAVLMALATKPVARKLCENLKFHPIVASVLIVLFIMGIGIGGMFALSGPAGKWISEAPQKFQEVERKIRPVKESVEEITEATGHIEKMTEAARDPSKVKVEVARPTLTSTVLSMTAEVGLEFLIAISCLFLLLAFGDDFMDRIADLKGNKTKNALIEMVKSAEEMISLYLFRFTLINCVLGLVIGLGMWALGMPNPALWGVMAACLNFVPYLGLIAGSSIVFFVAIVEFDSLLKAAIAPAIYIIANAIEANAVTPSLLGKALSVHVIVLFFGILLLGWLWGIGGVLIAVPLIATFRVMCSHFEPLKPVAQFLGGGSKEPSVGFDKKS